MLISELKVPFERPLVKQVAHYYNNRPHPPQTGERWSGSIDSQRHTAKKKLEENFRRAIAEVYEDFGPPVAGQLAGVTDLLTKWQPGILDAIELLREYQPSGIKFDLHSGNLMQRKDGTIVIIDPYVKIRQKASVS